MVHFFGLDYLELRNTTLSHASILPETFMGHTNQLVVAPFNYLSMFFGGSSSVSEFGRRLFPRHQEKRIEELAKILKESEHRRARNYAAMSLAEIGEPAVDQLIILLKHDQVIVRAFSADALGRIKSDKAVFPHFRLPLNPLLRQGWMEGWRPSFHSSIPPSFLAKV